LQPESVPDHHNTFSNAVARSLAQGINGYAGFQLFANDAYSHYHSLQSSLTRRWAQATSRRPTVLEIHRCDIDWKHRVQYGL